MRIAPMDSAGSKEDRAVSRPLKTSVDGEGSQRSLEATVKEEAKGVSIKRGLLNKNACWLSKSMVGTARWEGIIPFISAAVHCMQYPWR